MPHINLIYPFRPKEEFETLAKQFSLACECIEPFEIKLGVFRFFRHNRECYTLWLAPEPREELIRLQTVLWRVVPDCNDMRKYENGFTPHLSIGQVKGQTAMLKLLNELQNTWHPVLFTMKEVSILCRGNPPDDAFRIAHEVELGKQKV